MVSASGGARYQEIVARLDLARPLAPLHPDAWEGGVALPQQVAALTELRTSLAGRVAEMTTSDRSLAALEHLDEFVASTGRKLFVDPSTQGGLRYNQESLDLFAEHVRRVGSRKRGRMGEPISADAISGYVSAVRLLLEREQRMRITGCGSGAAAVVMFRHMRREDPPKGERRLCRAMRTAHFRRALELGYDRTSARGMVRWTAALLAHNLLLRGGELGVSKQVRGADWRDRVDWARTLTPADVDWREPCAESRWLPWCTVDVVGAKDTEFRHRVTSMPIRRRASWADQPVLGGDPLDTYDALLVLWRARRSELTPGECSYRAPCRAPLFTTEDGVRPWCTADTRALAREFGRLLGIPEEDTGGKAFRQGGATDMREIAGDAAAAALIKERGRWASDIHQIYTKVLIRSVLDASAAVAGAASRDMEEMISGWVQPATYHPVGR